MISLDTQMPMVLAAGIEPARPYEGQRILSPSAINRNGPEIPEFPSESVKITESSTRLDNGENNTKVGTVEQLTVNLLNQIISLRRTDARGNTYINTTPLPGIIREAERLAGVLNGQ